MDLVDIFPPLGVTVTCGPVSLEPLTDANLGVLLDTALLGVRPDGVKPFIQAWDLMGPERLPLNSAQFLWGERASFTPDSWHLNFLVRHEGEAVGSQGIHGIQFRQTRSLATGSWLARPFHGRGIGTLMRQAAVAFGFDELGAEQMTSGAWADNPNSNRVSEKVGYRPLGSVRRAREGTEWALHNDLLVTPETFARPPHPVVATGVPALRRFLGLDDG